MLDFHAGCGCLLLNSRALRHSVLSPTALRRGHSVRCLSRGRYLRYEGAPPNRYAERTKKCAPRYSFRWTALARKVLMFQPSKFFGSRKIGRIIETVQKCRQSTAYKSKYCK